MPYRSGALNSALIKETVAEESHESPAHEPPSPVGTAPASAITPASEAPQSIRRWSTAQSDGQPRLEPAGYFPSAVDTVASEENPTQPQSSSRRTSGTGQESKDSSQPSSRRPSQNLWTRSRSFAGSYIKPRVQPETGRPRGSEARRGSSVAPPFSAVGEEDAVEVAVDGSEATSRRSSGNKAASSTTASQPGSRTGSFSAPLRKGLSHQEGMHRRSESGTRPRREQRGSISEYIRPRMSAEKGRRRSSGTNKQSTVPSETAPVFRPVLERMHSAPSNSLFKNPVAWTPSFKPSDTPPYGKYSRHPSIAEDPMGEPVEKVRSSLCIHEKHVPKPGVYFRSRRIKEHNTDHSWLKQRKDPRQKWLTIIPLIGIILGFCIAGAYIFLGVQDVPMHKYCMVYEDTFSSGTLDSKVWTKEVEVGGFGNGQFEETTGTDENVFIKDGMLQIKPTLQDITLLTGNHTLNLTQLGTCTGTKWSDCVATTNSTNGTIINPVKSGRINTKKGANIKYGRIEVEAKMPQGDWLWPAIWMLPTDTVYGTWPRSGEIDIAESRGNNWTYPTGGNNIMSSTLHWGPDSSNDAWWRTYGKQHALHSTFSEKFHTFGLEWSEKYLYTYLDGRLMQVLYNKFRTPFWKRGHFPLMYANGTAIVNPWGQTGNAATPFDQDFYLVLNVAVGGTNGWFKDGEASKPWVDASPTAKRDFWAARDQWYPTWDNENGPAMQVRSVKMWQQQGYNGCGSDAKSI
ncbi:Beta-1,3-glucan-binding protein [Exophiala dermatitidis]